MRFSRPTAAVALLAVAPSVSALTGDEVFARVSPSVVVVRGLDASERPLGYGSGVVVGPGSVVTNCHVLARARSVQVQRGNASFDARLEHADAGRNLCLLSAKGFDAPAVPVAPVASAKVGQRVFAIGNPERLALTLSEGLVSGLRSEDPALPPIQTTAQISPGSSGGGLFDAEGRLLGITTFAVPGRDRLAQNLNFAIPAEWIAEVPERAKAALAARRAAAPAAVASAAPAQTVAAAPGLPAPGASYRYLWKQGLYSRTPQEIQVRVNWINGSVVGESYTAGADFSGSATIDASRVAFTGRPLAEGQSLLEFAPYLPSLDLGKLLISAGSTNYPQDIHGYWSVAVSHADWEPVVTGAGSFRAMRVDITGSRHAMASGAHSMAGVPGRFQYTVWYAPEVKRYVKIRHQVWNILRSEMSDDQVELLSYGG